jgi:protein-disulfide isomerase
MISCSIVIAFGDGNYSLPFFQSEELECDPAEPLSNDCLKQYAKDVDLKYSKFKSCIEDEKYDSVIDKEIEQADGYNVQGTPYVVIGVGSGDTIEGFYAGGAQGYDYYQALIENVKEAGLEKARAELVQEQFGTLEELTARYKEAYAEQGATGEELNELASQAAQEQFDSMEIREFSLGDGIVTGGEDAELVLMIFSDFECPYCSSFALNTLPDLQANYIDKGELKFVFRDFPLESIHTKARRSANAARCANEQGKFLEYHDALFEASSSSESE